METKPTKIVVYYCHNLGLFQNRDQKDFARSRPGLSLVAIPCSGKVEAHHLLKTLASGAEGVLVLACAEKACQYLEGSMRARKRVGYAKRWLEQLDIEPDRLEFVNFPRGDEETLDRTLKEFASKLESFSHKPAIANAKAS
ncbi:MAG: hydrogenase iron-sulfur subunit [Desulfomonilaceae bacterium]